MPTLRHPAARLGVALATVALAAPLTSITNGPAEPPPPYVAAADGAGDPYLPLAGNGGIDIQHTALDLTYTPPDPAPAPLEGHLEGTATLTLQATDNLRSFNLDLRGLRASSVIIDGQDADLTQHSGNELTISPRPRIEAGDTVEVVVHYAGTTGQPTDAADSPYGWITTREGARVISEPDGAATWFPTSDHPTDKSTYAFDVTVPEGLTAVANGLLEGSSTEDGWTTWSWDAPDPMAAYLATAAIGEYELRETTSNDGVPILDAVHSDLPARPVDPLEKVPEMMDFFSEILGPYPFGAYGAIVDRADDGYALETQTRSYFSRPPAEATVAHELVHQWAGDHVSVERWSDIWHNEGWATYGSWLWSEAQGGPTAQDSFHVVMATPADDPFWDLVIGDPGPKHLFDDPIYDRSAAMLFALREKIGDEAFSEVTRTWFEEHAGSAASTQEYIALAEDVSGQELDGFFEAWLFTAGKPEGW